MQVKLASETILAHKKSAPTLRNGNALQRKLPKEPFSAILIRARLIEALQSQRWLIDKAAEG